MVVRIDPALVCNLLTSNEIIDLFHPLDARDAVDGEGAGDQRLHREAQHPDQGAAGKGQGGEGGRGVKVVGRPRRLKIVIISSSCPFINARAL